MADVSNPNRSFDQGLEASAGSANEQLSDDAASLYKGVVELFDQGDYVGAIIEDAVAKFESGDYVSAEAAAIEALGTAENMNDMLPDEQIRTQLGSYEGDRIDRWRMALDRLTGTYGDSGESETAEGTFLRMLAWREGIHQQQFGQSTLACGLFQKSMEYNCIDDATWFLRSLKPDDGHAVAEVIPLLALGERVAAKAAVATWTLALRPKHRTQITDRGGLELLAKAIAQYPDNPELAAAGCGALRLLCQGHARAAQNRRTLTLKLEGPLILICSMQTHRFDLEVQREACGALAAIATDYPPGAASIIAKDGLLMLLEAMISCQDQSVGDAACKALATICGRNASTSPGKPEDVMGAEEGVEEVGSDVEWQVALRQECGRGLAFSLKSLEEQVSEGHRLVLQSLLWATMIFLDDSSLRQQAIHMASSVVHCMIKFPGHAQIQVPACGIIWRLTVGHSARDEAVQNVAEIGAIGPICQAMRDLACNMDLQQLAIGALRNIAFGNDANKTLVVKDGGIKAVVTGMKRYPKDAKLQEQGIGALTSLCDTVGRAAACAKQGGIEVIIGALKRHASVGHIAELGCIILCMFCDDQQLKHVIMKSGALQIAKALSRTENSEAQQWGCELLRDLSDS